MSERTRAERLLRFYLEQIAQLAQPCRREGHVYACAADFVLQHGRAYPPGDRAGYPRGAERCCFGNAIVLAVQGGLPYVEGYALTPLGCPIHHAWNTGPDGAAVDITWPTPGRAYLGVEFGVERADDATWNGDGSVLDDWRRGWPLFRAAWTGERSWDGYEPSPALAVALKLARRMFHKRGTK